MINKRNNSGITLIALVITIILLLILAGVALNTITRGNIIENANNAVDKYNRNTGDDQNLINEVDELLSQYGDGGETYTAYQIGDEVSITVGGKTEYFYVLENSGENQSTVTLLAKYNLDKNPDQTTGNYYQKPDVDYNDTSCSFASTNYWNFENGTEQVNLNTYTTDAVASANGQTEENNAIMRARYYATQTIDSSATGRLLTYEEANTLINNPNYYDMITGWGNVYRYGSSDYHGLNYWLSDVSISLR